MAFDKTRTEYHLTTTGWVQGNFKVFNNIQGNTLDRPENCVETWEVLMVQSSSFSKEEFFVNKIWTNGNYSSDDVLKIKSKFELPKELEV